MKGSAFKNIEGFEHSNKFTNCPSMTYFSGRRFFAINNKYLAILLNDPGKINIADSNKPRNLSSENYQLIEGVNKNILDLEFSPFNSNILAFSNDNNSVILSTIDDRNNEFNSKSVSYSKHVNKTVSFLNFNPISSNIISSCSLNGELHIWDPLKLKKIFDKTIPGNPFEINWSPDGSLLGISTKTKEFYYCDTRNKKLILTSIKPYSNQKFAWIDNNFIASVERDTYFQKFLRMIDIRKPDNSYSEILIDKNISQTYPFVDNELKIIYTVGKEEKNIKIYDCSQGKLQYCKEYKCSEPNYLSIIMNKRYVDKSKNEIDRLIRYTTTKEIYYVGFADTNIKKQNFIDNRYSNVDLGAQSSKSEQYNPEQSVPFVRKNFYVRKRSDHKQQTQTNNNSNVKEQNNDNSNKNSINIGVHNVYKFINIHKKNEPEKVAIPKKVYNAEKVENECNNCNNLRKKIQQLESDKKVLSEEKNNLSNDNKSKETKISISEKKYNDILKEYQKLTTDYKNLLKENENQKNEIKAKSSLNNLINNRKNSLTYENKIKENQKQIEELKASLITKKEEINKLSTELFEKQKKFDDLFNKYNSEIPPLKQTIKEKEKNISKLEESISCKKQQLEANTKKENNLNNQIKDKNKIIESKDKELKEANNLVSKNQKKNRRIKKKFKRKRKRNRPIY